MRWPVTSQLVKPGNLAIACTRQVNRPSYEHALATQVMLEKKTVSHDRNTQVFPVLVETAGEHSMFGSQLAGNWDASFASLWQERFGRSPHEPLEARRVAAYVYAILHSPTYRLKYFTYLKSDFPRFPVTHATDLCDSLATKGEELMALHFFETEPPGESRITIIGTPPLEVERVSYEEDVVWVDRRRSRGLQPVSSMAWGYRIGGYQVLEKWMKDRKGRSLSTREIAHYKRIVLVIEGTNRLMGDIDHVIEKHGGWPEAFA